MARAGLNATMNPILELLGRRLRLAVIGGGPGSFIGPVHRTAARLDDRFEIVAGVLSGDPARSRTAAAAIGIAPDRAYADWPALLAGRAGARRRRRRGRGDDAQRQPPCDLRRSPGAGLRRDLRQAADDLARRRARPRAPGARERPRVLPDPQLHRLPDGPAGARHGPRRRDRRRCARSSSSTSRATTPRWSRARAAQLALRSGRLRPVPDPGRHRHPRPSPGRLRLRPGAGGGDGRGLGQRARARGRRHGQRPDALVGRRRARCGSPTPPPAPSTAWAFASSATRAGWNGGRSSPTSCATAGSAASSRC